MKRSVLLPIFLISYIIVIFPFTSHLRNKPFSEKLGYVPQPEILRLISADQKQLVSAALMFTTITYYGGFYEKIAARLDASPDYFDMYKMIATAVRMDPYNMDGYYFAQAVLAWDVRGIHEANELLEYGMKYRDWDYYLPYFAGFNYAYFLKDYANAAAYYKRVGELLGTDLPINLAGRYMYESGRTDMAINYLSLMIKSGRNEAVTKNLQIRLEAFKEARKIELAVEKFQQKTKRLPSSVDELLRFGYLKELPVDPYGGAFYIEKDGKVRTTSKFAFGVVRQRQK